IYSWCLLFFLFPECIFICISSQFSPNKRKCAFKVTSQNDTYKTAGNVNGSVQVCESTHCCLGYYLNIDGHLETDALACNLFDEACPHATCRAQTLFNSRFIKCVCNTDLCNTNITWTPESKQPRSTNSFSVGMTIIQLLAKACPHDFCISPPTTKTSEIDIADIDLEHILSHGHFAAVWQGKYQGSVVAVKIFPAGWKDKFTAEKEVYELPLMKHAGIVHFLGSGRKPDNSSWLIVLQFAEYGSLHSFLCKQTTNWMLSLKLCQSLSQGLSYLHSDLHRYDVRKPPVAHRDLSSSNVLVRADGTCALCDFGCSTILRSLPEHRHWKSRMTNIEGPTQMGTLRYMSPEILEGYVNLSSSWCLMHGDIYSLGLLLWEIWMRCSDLFEGSNVPQHLLPYESELGASVTLESLVVFVVHLDNRPVLPEDWKLLPQGTALRELLSECWDCDPDARLTAQCVVDRLVSLQPCFFP
uniref:receptor protein serine/threonine kinase n=1 Tax=Mastacembelus armatus TaxID=205130 RepID=A0A3Q3M244_9TELE